MKRRFIDFAIIWLVSCALVVSVVAASAACCALLDIRHDRKVAAMANTGSMKTIPAAEAQRLVRECEHLSREAVNRTWTGFSEAPYKSDHLNIDAEDPLPVRHTIHSLKRIAASRPIAVWLFGGSTSFGYGLPDEQTIATHLEAELTRECGGCDVRVINHGHFGYFSSQEVALLSWLYRSAHRADLAIFLDGVNESVFHEDGPGGQMVPASRSVQIIAISPWFPPSRLLSEIVARVRARRTQPPPDKNKMVKLGADAAARYETNVRAERAIANAMGTKTLFVWQPTPYAYHSRPKSDPVVQRILAVRPENDVIKYANEHVRNEVHENDFVFMADLFEHDRFADTYIDWCHYGDAASLKIAKRLAGEIVQRGYLKRE